MTCPFQYDSVYCFENVDLSVGGGNDLRSASEDENNKNNDDDDPFGALKTKLEKNELPMFCKAVGDGSSKETLRPARAFNDAFVQFRDEHMKDVKEYPRFERFLSAVDRRDAEEDKKIIKEDEIIFFAPPDNCRKIPRQVNPFYFFDSARTCVIPDQEYSKKLKNGDGLKNLDALKNVTSMTLKKGILISFHCLSADEIRCYIYIRGQGMRFLPEDIMYCLPVFFDKEFADNATWPTSDESKKLVDELNKKLRDDAFMAFFKNESTQKAPNSK